MSNAELQMPEWKLSLDHNCWEYREGESVLATLRWDREAGNFGAYVDGDGRPVSKKFDESREIIEKRAKGEK
jgi:hypothetical protein